MNSTSNRNFKIEEKTKQVGNIPYFENFIKKTVGEFEIQWTKKNTN